MGAPCFPIFPLNFPLTAECAKGCVPLKGRLIMQDFRMVTACS
jgi:hypothetical protein